MYKIKLGKNSADILFEGAATFQHNLTHFILVAHILYLVLTKTAKETELMFS